MLDPVLRPQTLPTPWLRAAVRISGWWLCATVLKYLQSDVMPGSAALGVYGLLVSPLAIVVLAGVFTRVQARWMPASGTPDVAGRLLMLIEIMSTFSLVLLLAPS